MKIQGVSLVLILFLFISTTPSSASPHESYKSISELYWSDQLQEGLQLSGYLVQRESVNGTTVETFQSFLHFDIKNDLISNILDESYDIFDDISLIGEDGKVLTTKETIYYGISPVKAILNDSSEYDFVSNLWVYLVVADLLYIDDVDVSVSLADNLATYTGLINYGDALGDFRGRVNTTTGIVKSINFTIEANNGSIKTTTYNLLNQFIMDGSPGDPSTELTNPDESYYLETDTTIRQTPIGLSVVIASLYVVRYRKNGYPHNDDQQSR